MSVFSKVPSVHLGRSAFNLSYEKKFDGDMGYLYPVLCEECVPGDTWKVGNAITIRFNPLVSPIMHEINAFVHYFFVPTRLLFTDDDIPAGSNLSKFELWENFLSQGKDGQSYNENSNPDSVDLPLPRWFPTVTPTVGSLWDYFGFPLVVPDDNHCPLAFCKRAYNLIYNNYYRDENLMDELDLDSDVLQRRCWEKDYFTSALPWQQRGIAPALPVTGSSVFDFSSLMLQHKSGDTTFPVIQLGNGAVTNKLTTDSTFFQRSSTNGGNVVQTRVAEDSSESGFFWYDPLSDKYLSTHNSLSTATFDVSDLRLAFQIQKWMERNARGGVRYTEFLRSHFGVSPRDERLQRPEYIGGSKSPVIISEVLQTSGTQGAGGTQVTPQGNLAGHGLTSDSSYVGSYHCQEFGYIVGILSIMPRSNYQQGIDRQWLRRTRYDFYFPEFSHLSEQAIETAEIYTDTTDEANSVIFGYQGRYNEMRSKRSIIAGHLRSNVTGSLDFWHLARDFASAPILNSSFLECNPRKDIFAVQDYPGMIITFGNLLRAIRPMPIFAVPGLIDHN